MTSFAAYPSLPGAGSGCADACKAESSSALTLLMFVLQRGTALSTGALTDEPQSLAKQNKRYEASPFPRRR